MKKIVYLTLVGCLAVLVNLFSFAPQTSAAASVTYTLYIDGTVSTAKFPTVVEKNATLIPMKAVLAELNYTTTVDNRTKAITAKNSAGSYITVTTGSKKAKINGSAVTLSVAAKAMNGTTYIPLSAVKQLTGKAIGADASERIAWIGEKPAATAPLPVWGVSPKQMKVASANKFLLDEGGQGDIYLLLYQDNYDDPEELYIFYKNKLAKIAFTPEVSGYDESFAKGVYEGMLASLTKNYGPPEKDIIAADKDTLEEIPLADGGYLTSEWNAGGTKIKLLLKGTDNGYALSLQYVDTSVEAQLEAALDAIE